jgi:hypothetical protein
VGGFAGLADAAAAIASADGHHLAVAAIASTLAWSGAVKLRQPMPAAWALVDFRVVRHVRRCAGLALGLLEAGVALALIAALAAGATPTTAAAGAAALLFAAFAAAIGAALRRGASFDCACFGAEDTPLSAFTLARAVLLCGASAVLAATASTAGPVNGAGDVAATLVAGTSAVGTCVLLASTPRLLSWNRDPFALDNRLYEAWATT